MTVQCSACGGVESHDKHCSFVAQIERLEARDKIVGRHVGTGTLPSPLARQVDGGHYKGLKIQPLEYIHANGIPFAEGCVIKYVSRWRAKGGIKDLEKAKHFLELLIELETRNV